MVIATHGRKGIDALVHPSVTWQVLRQTDAPILTCPCASDEDHAALSLHLLRFMTDPTTPILVALDGSLQAEEALPVAEELARTSATRSSSSIRSTRRPLCNRETSITSLASAERRSASSSTTCKHSCSRSVNETPSRPSSCARKSCA
jgi:hypothetical protein